MVRTLVIACVAALHGSPAAGIEATGVERNKPVSTCSTGFLTEEVDTDMAGTLVAEKWSPTADGCCALCDKEPECEGFSFADYTCYLKKAFIGTYSQAGVITRVKSAGKCAGFTGEQEGKDLAGRLLEDWHALAPEVCCRACSRKQECQGYAFFDSRCYLKADATHTFNKTGSVAQLKEGSFSTTPAPTCSASFEAEELDTDMSGTLIAEKWALTGDGCCNLCEEEAECEGFSFVNHTCYLKKNFIGTYTQAGVFTRVKSVENCVGFTGAQEGQDLAGRLLEDWHAQAPEVCCRACSRKRECHGYAFFGSRCYLKADVTHTFNKTGCVAQVKEGLFSTTPWPTCSASFEAEELDTDMSGTLIADKWASTSDGCCALCEDESECEGFSFVDHTCYLKKNFIGTYTQAGVVTRVKSMDTCAGFAGAQQGKDLAGRLLEEWHAQAPEVCCMACSRKQECQGFTFFDSRCYLKADVTHTFNKIGCVAQVRDGHRRLDASIIV